MPGLSLGELVPVLQVAVGPVILVSGIGLLLLSMTNRLGRVVDRSRALSRDLRSSPPQTGPRLRAQLDILAGRARLLQQAIILATVSVLLAAGPGHRSLRDGHPRSAGRLADRGAVRRLHAVAHRFAGCLHPRP